MKPPRISRDWRDISYKLPLLTTTLLLAAVLVIAGLAYEAMRRSLTVAASARVGSVSQELARSFAASNRRLQQQGSPLSHDSTLRALLVRPTAATRAAAAARLAAERRTGTTVSAVAVRTRTGALVLENGAAPRDAAAADSAGAGGVVTPIAPLATAHDTVLNEVRLPVLGTASDTVGYLYEYSRVSSADSRKLLQGLMGNNALLLIGNQSGDVWTDLDRRVTAPGSPTTLAKGGWIITPNGTRWLGAIAPVGGTPWLVWVALPESVVTSQAHDFLLYMALVALFVVAAGAVGAWRMSRHIIAPLTEVTHAAERLANGEYAARAAVARRDEVGRLGKAFNEMASSIEIATQELQEQQVELETQQAELEETNEALVATIDDAVTARQAAEQAHARSAAIVAAAIAGIVTVSEDGAIVEFNPAAERMFECPAARAIGRPLAELLPGVQLDAPVMASSIDVTAFRADGTEFPVELAVTRVPLRDRTLFTCFIHDQSQRRQLEAQLQQSQKMEAVGRLAGGVAHDFNNILTVIISYTELVLADAGVQHAVREDLTRVRTAADRATALTRQLLAFSRKQVLRPVVLDINGAVGEVAAMLSRVIPANIRLEAKLAGALDRVYVDRGQLEQVLMNLAVNARDAMPDGGALTIETSNAVLDDAYVSLHPGGTAGAHVVLSVRDTGMGMDAITRERVFEPFFTTKGPGQGTGLGLATVYGIVRQSGGSIYVYSEPGRGTTFKVYFPAHTDAAAADAPAPVPEAPVSGPLAVLLVEDDPAVRDATCMVLERMGHAVVPASNVAEALAIVRSGAERIDVVLTDAVMPGQSGLDLVDALALERPDLPVVLMSGYSEEAVSGGHNVPAGVVFVEKPFTGADIARAFADVKPAGEETAAT